VVLQRPRAFWRVLCRAGAYSRGDRIFHIAGVDPKVGPVHRLAWRITAIVGGRPGLISAATGRWRCSRSPEHGLQCPFCYTIRQNFEILFGDTEVWSPNEVCTRCCDDRVVLNALAIWFYGAAASMCHQRYTSWWQSGLQYLHLAEVHKGCTLTTGGDRRANGSIIIGNIDVPTVGDMGVAQYHPSFILPNVLRSMQKPCSIFPYALTVVGLLESLLTALLDELTDTPSSRTREAEGGQNCQLQYDEVLRQDGRLYHGGQSVINIQSGGRKRLNTVFEGFPVVLYLGVG